MLTLGRWLSQYARWLSFFRLLPDDDNFKRLIERRRQLTRKAEAWQNTAFALFAQIALASPFPKAVLGHLKSMQAGIASVSLAIAASLQVTDATPLAFTSFRSQAIQIAGKDWVGKVIEVMNASETCQV